MEHASFLRDHIERIVGLTDDEFAEILPKFKPRHVSKKEFLIKSGDKVQSEFLVVKGLLKAFVLDESGKEHILQFAMENWWVSDYAAYSVQDVGEVSIQALEPCLVLEFSLLDKSELCRRIPKMYRFHGEKSFSGYVALQKRVLSFMKNSAKEKYQLLLRQYPQLFQRVSKTLIAQYLGVSRETLSRLEKREKE
ncbi:MAG: Crp/Fnr family transcriptional regulator [Flavobacterium sp.]|uniref:Crp/Fnr family transcriptional regulator n=1 Tax=Flavobacterium sp. TaxID=239 RepID=UPI00121396C2|nr:Crp/Fnr family transcriptional regulator [Flavobacterium sp.]RZJ68768.1 MAG: Crp/Fnr family transcriptional regulator [Flavobacterium sp.]